MMAEAIQDATMALKKALIERALGGELSHHLGYPPGGDKPAEAGNHRNGSTGKTALTEDGPLRIEVPRMVRGSERPRSPLSRFEGLVLAGKEGFEPSVLEYQYAGFPIRCIRPLCHLPGVAPQNRAPIGLVSRTADSSASWPSA